MFCHAMASSASANSEGKSSCPALTRILPPPHRDRHKSLGAYPALTDERTDTASFTWSVNGQIEFLLRKALRDAGRTPRSRSKRRGRD